MNIFPAVNIKNGHCVKLKPEQYHDAEIYSHSPWSVARGWEEEGASLLHVTDVDGALVGHTANESTIREIVESVSIPVEVGGGIRSIQAIEKILNLGVSRVVIGTKAVGNPGFIKDAIGFFGENRIVVAIDARHGMVAVEGWEKISTYNAVSLAIEMRDLGIRTIQYMDIARDGLMAGPNIEHISEMVKATGLNVIVSGGIYTLKDLELVQQIGVHGAIIDRALYEKKIELKEAIELFT